MNSLRTATVALIVLGAACSSQRKSSSIGAPLVGVWGGQRLALTLTDSGGVLEYDCAHGRIDVALIPDSDGAFTAHGSHFREHGGPVRVDEPVDSVSARYFGKVMGDRIRLSVVAENDTLGPFDLQLGAPPSLVRCL